MNPATRLALYGVALAAVFGGALLAGNTLVPDALVSDWTSVAEDDAMDHGGSR